jgi:AcrR family transcriptional regulator
MLRTAKATATRAALLEAAADELNERGWDATTSTAVAARAGVATGTFYTYFADKQAALVALFDASLAQLLSAVEGTLTADNLLDRGLGATLRDVLGLVLEGYRRDAAVIRTALGQVTTSSPLRTVYWQRHAEAAEMVERFVRRGQAAGLVREGDAHVLAHTLLLLTQGLNHPVLLATGDGGLAEGVHEEVVRVAQALLAPTGHAD